MVAFASAGSDPPSAPIPRDAVRLEIGPKPNSRPVPDGFVGFSVEFPSAAAYAGPDPAAPNPLYTKLLKNLANRPVIRVGGDTTDWSWWPTPAVPQPRGIRFTLNQDWVRRVHAAAAAMDAKMIIGINFEADSSAIARTESRVLLNGIGPRYLEGFELGNEPEVYGALGWYSLPDGTPVYGRSRSYSFAQFLPDYKAVAAALPRSVPLVGPASGAPHWLAGLGQFLADQPRVRVTSFHRYPLHRCFTRRSSPAFPSIHNLLAPESASGPASSLAAAVRVAHAHGLPLRSDELNSVSCGGAHGVSDVFASALWSLDTLFWMARVGVDGVNIHTFKDAIYEPFAFSDTRGHWSAQVKPLYYGLLMFTRAAPAGSRLLPVSAPAASGLRTWATEGPGTTQRVLLINDSARRARTAAISLPSAGKTGSTILLKAPSVRAARGIELGGQSFGAPTATGSLQGTPQVTPTKPTHGRYVVRVPPASAALLIVAQ